MKGDILGRTWTLVCGLRSASSWAVSITGMTSKAFVLILVAREGLRYDMVTSLDEIDEFVWHFFTSHDAWEDFYAVDLFILRPVSVVVEEFGYYTSKKQQKTLQELSKQHLMCGKSETDGSGSGCKFCESEMTKRSRPIRLGPERR